MTQEVLCNLFIAYSGKCRLPYKKEQKAEKHLFPPFLLSHN